MGLMSEQAVRLVPGNPVGVEVRPEWSVRMAMDVALGTSTDAILEAYELQYPRFEAICGDPKFAAKVFELRKELEKEGVSFKVKAQMQAEEYLTTAWNMVQNPLTDPKVRADLIKATVRWGGLEAPAVGPRGGSGFTVNINLGGANDYPAIEGERE